MPLSPGDQLGPYEILASIGAGGMGEVYRARDTRLRRDVAIKVSAERFSERFETEARAIASLNHPNVCTLHDVGPNYLVMELVEGETLAERIAQGAILIDESLVIAQQIADALEAAHEKGITHRDLKPGNIKIKPDGVVKVLDFGLAKMGGTPTVKSDNSPTLTMGATQAGVILGTAAYMAPEQARGKEVDRRADIWAFGVVLYEMLTGQKLFKGDDLSETLASVIKDEPKLERAPAKVQRLLRTCLKKDPKQRLQAIGDWSLLLEEQAQAKARAAKLPWVVAALGIVAAAIALWALWHKEQPVDLPLVRLDVDLGADVSLATPAFCPIAISPDGTRLVYRSGAPLKLVTRRLDQPKVTELPGTEGSSSPFFSADGKWVGFRAARKLNKISVEGGAIVPLGDFSLTAFAGASWGEDGSVIFSQTHKGLLRLPAAGGLPETVAEVNGAEFTFASPQILPGGKAVLLAVDTRQGIDNDTIEVLTLADRRRKVVVRGGRTPRFLATSKGSGHLVYVNKTTLFAIPFDPDKLETRGTAVPILDDVAYRTGFWEGQFAFSSGPSGHGTLVYVKSSGGSSDMVTLQWVDPTGKKEPLRAKPGLYEDDPNLSPDGKRVALVVAEGASKDIWVYDQQRDVMTRLTFGGMVYSRPIWSPDGGSVVFLSEGHGIWQARADGAGQPQALMQSHARQVPECFTPDGKRLAYADHGAGNPQIWTVPLEAQGGQLKAGKPEQFLKSGFIDYALAFSPDGRWLAYYSYESGRPEVYVRPFPPPSSGQGGKWQISNNGGTDAKWSRNGHELIYQSGTQLMAVSYTMKGDTFVQEKPHVWIDKLGGTDWDLAPDGNRVLVLTPVESAEGPKPEHEVVFLINFFDELRRRVPAGK